MKTTTKTLAIAATLLTAGQAGATPNPDPTTSPTVIDRPALTIAVDAHGRLIGATVLGETDETALENMEELERVAGNWNCNCGNGQR